MNPLGKLINAVGGAVHQGGKGVLEASRQFYNIQKGASQVIGEQVQDFLPPISMVQQKFLGADDHQSQQQQRQQLQPYGYIQSREQLLGKPPDPFQLVKAELESVFERLRCDVVTNIPKLETAANHFFRSEAAGKRLRPTMLLLMSSALSPIVPSAAYLEVDHSPPGATNSHTRRKQQRLAEATEMIHVATLLHDDVIDEASTRRGLASVNAFLGNKLAILSGDFLLARASMTLASLGDTQVVWLMSQVLESLVSGELLQAGKGEAMLDFEHYQRRIYYKTAALMANSLRSVAILGQHSQDVCDAVSQYGSHLGIAFQIVDDILDFKGSATSLGKPALNDLRSGIATAPVLFAAQQHPQLRALIVRRFSQPGDVQEALEYVGRSSGVERAQQLAGEHAQKAAWALAQLPPPENVHADISREALQGITNMVLKRTK